MGEVASALQKSIRRGWEDEALFWGTELDMSGYGEYCWKRLKIMTSEDVGLAEPMMSATIHALYESWLAQRKKGDSKHAPERLFLVHAVLALVRCKKSRIVDHALVKYYEGPRVNRKIPDVALDQHTARGRRLKRGAEHFFTEGIVLANQELPDPYLEEAKAIRSGKHTQQGELLE